MPRSKKSRRTRLLVVVVAVLVVLGVVAGGYLSVRTVRASFPQTSGQIHLSGLSGPVDVRRDGNGIPQIYADSAADLFQAQGYVQAQDRFWQMDVDRHITAGTLSEMFGSREIETDAFVRSMGWRQVAQQEYDHELSASTKRYLRSFTDGVNAWLADHPGGSGASVEYPLLGTVHGGYQPAKWTPVDSVAWLKALAWTQSGNMQQEIERALLSEDFSKQQIAQLFPDSAGSAGSVVKPASSSGSSGSGSGSGTSGSTADTSNGGPTGGQNTSPDLSTALTDLPALLGSPGSGIGANAWAVSGSHTTTGKPLLANDPHTSVNMPSPWYQMGLHCNSVDSSCPYDVTGYTAPGMPGVVIGHNQSIAWGLNPLGADDQDLYLEDVTGSDTYLYDGRDRRFTVRQETIKVAGGSDRHITVRTTVDGPLLSDHSTALQTVGQYAPAPTTNAPDRKGGYGVALKWSALTPGRSMDAVLDLDKATDFSAFRAAAREFTSPAQGLVYADTAGNIGYQASGEVPERSASVRTAGGNGTYPMPGWDSAYGWKGTVPSSELPSALNPSSGYLVSADQAAGPDGTSYRLAPDTDYGMRAARITALIKSKFADGGRISTDDMEKIQLDDTSTMAKTLVPYLLKVNLKDYMSGSDVGYVGEAQDLLKDWNYQQDAESAAAAYYNAVWRNLLKLAFGDKFPETLRAKGDCRLVDQNSSAVLPGDDVGEKPQQVKVCGLMEPDQAQPDGGEQWMTVVTDLLGQPNSSWWNFSSKKGETTDRDKLLAQAMKDARYELTSLMGKSISGWSWGKVHMLRLNEPMLGNDQKAFLSGVFHKVLNRGPYQVDGGSAAVDASGWDAATGYGVDWVPSARMVVDLSDLDASQWIQVGGSSGHAFAGHYDDQTQKWADGKYLSWPYGSAAVKAATRDELVLTPTG
ncbi:penicillin acylase family protein [Phaeacidiphilus oryzae]|uniref:penicillin acylase family protein n=1 Tax=Phaeacidiphilus oryzae TaxID=348818 RepID=UPI00056C3981|nr:penicillin acylase family protein [Phaeacidiphilus oryzae]